MAPEYATGLLGLIQNLDERYQGFLGQFALMAQKNTDQFESPKSSRFVKIILSTAPATVAHTISLVMVDEGFDVEPQVLFPIITYIVSQGLLQDDPTVEIWEELGKYEDLTEAEPHVLVQFEGICEVVYSMLMRQLEHHGIDPTINQQMLN